jgi:hypothetical protein
MYVGKISTQRGEESVPPNIPDVINLPLDLGWYRSKVHNLLD